jgi:LPS sulfotransferase NodH
MAEKPRSYLLCGTPRTGSTLLCDLLASTGVAGRPESYFREPDRRLWAARFGIPVASDGSVDYRAFVAGAVRAGRTANGVFAARIMWGTMALIVDGLKPCPRGHRDIDILTEAFGPLVLVQLQREDVVGQAVSWARAEQSGYWQPGDVPSVAPQLDLNQIHDLVRTIHEHNRAWDTWFEEQGVQPYVVTYEEIVAEPRRAVRGILDGLGVEPPPTWRPESRHHKQADGTNADWVRRYRNWAERVR